MSKKPKDSITLRGGAANAFVAAAREALGDMVDADLTPDDLPMLSAPDHFADEADTDQGQRVSIDPGIAERAALVRDRKAIAAEWLEQKLRVECEQAKLASLADELGQDIAAAGETRHPIRIGAGLYKTRKDRDAKTFTLVDYNAPTAIEAL